MATRAPTRGDWLRIGALSLIWGTVFALVKVALEDTTPAYLTMMRLWVSAILLYAWAVVNGAPPPRLLPRFGGDAPALWPDPHWRWLAVLGLMTAAAPFTVIAIGQRAVPSALAGILVATVPLMTAVLSQIFIRADAMTPRKAIGLAVGFAGVVLLIGPAALGDLGGPAMWGQLLIVLGAFCYACAAVIAFRAPQMPAYSSAAGMLLAAAVFVTPLGLWDAFHGPPPSARALIAAAATGLGGSGVAMILYLQVVRSAGPSFTVLTNYMVPVVAMLTGALMGERLDPLAFVAFGVILAGVWLAGRRRG